VYSYVITNKLHCSALLSIFRTNQFFANAFLILYVLLIWSPAFVFQQELVVSEGAFLFDSLSQYLPAAGSLANYIIAAVFALLQAVLLNVMVSRYRLTEEITLFPGLFYLVLMGFSSSFWTVNPLLIANFFLLFAIVELVETYKEYSSADRIFNIGLFIGLASLCYFSYIIFLIFAWIGIGIVRAIQWKERLILIFGFICPYFLVCTYQYWQNELDSFIHNDIMVNLQLLSFSAHDGLNLWITTGLVGLMILVSIFSYKSYTYKKKIKIQKIIDILYWVLAVSALSLLIQTQINVQHFQILLPILAIFVSINFVQMSRQWSNLLHLFLLVGVLIWHYISNGLIIF